MRERKEREADWVGPTKMQSTRPRVQNTMAPRLCSANTPKPARTIALSETMMTFFGPIRSSRKPKAAVARPATTLEAIAKSMTSPALKPKALLARTAPKVNTPASPSRNTAEAMRKKRLCGASLRRVTTVLHRSL